MIFYTHPFSKEFMVGKIVEKYKLSKRQQAIFDCLGFSEMQETFENVFSVDEIQNFEKAFNKEK